MMTKKYEQFTSSSINRKLYMFLLGTTVRLSGVKGSQTNIQLTGLSKQNSVTQLAVGSQNNLIALSTQPKLVLSPQATTAVSASVISTKNSSKATSKAQTVTKFTPKFTQQLINAKFVTQNVDSQKIVQPKVIIGQSQVKLNASKNVTSKSVTLGVPSGGNTIRMVNTANLNLAHIGGKPVLLTNKGSTLQSLQGQNVIIQTQHTQPNSSGLVSVTVSKAASTGSSQQTTASSISLLNQQNTQVVLTPQIKVQQTPQVILSSNLKTNSIQQTQNAGQIVLGGHPVRLQAASSTSTQRVVLAGQGQGGQFVAQQILLPPGFQGTAINIKALQGVKVIPIAQGQHNKGITRTDKYR